MPPLGEYDGEVIDARPLRIESVVGTPNADAILKDYVRDSFSDDDERV